MNISSGFASAAGPLHSEQIRQSSAKQRTSRWSLSVCLSLSVSVSVCLCLCLCLCLFVCLSDDESDEAEIAVEKFENEEGAVDPQLHCVLVDDLPTRNSEIEKKLVI